LVVKVVKITTVLLVFGTVVVTAKVEVEAGIVDVDTTDEVSTGGDDVLAEVVWTVLLDDLLIEEDDWEVDETLITEALLVALDVSEEDVSEVEDEAPLLNAALWRFAIAMA